MKFRSTLFAILVILASLAAVTFAPDAKSQTVPFDWDTRHLAHGDDGRVTVDGNGQVGPESQKSGSVTLDAHPTLSVAYDVQVTFGLKALWVAHSFRDHENAELVHNLGCRGSFRMSDTPGGPAVPTILYFWQEVERWAVTFPTVDNQTLTTRFIVEPNTPITLNYQTVAATIDTGLHDDGSFCSFTPVIWAFPHYIPDE